MTSKLVVNTIEADTGISSVSFASSISLNSGSKFHFSDAGIDIGADTNINRPAAGVLGFNINSSEKVRVASSGYIGIGTDNPQKEVDIIDASNSQDVRIWSKGDQNSSRLILRTGNNGNSFVLFGDTADEDIGAIRYVHHSDENSMRFITNTQERVRITSNGSVVVGGDTPATVGQTQLTLRSNSQVGLSLLCGAIQNATITFGGLADGYSSGDSGYDDGKIMYDNSNNHMQFNTAGGERLRITSGGTVNIGGDYANTTGKLKVTGTTTIDGNLSVSQKIVHTGDTDTLIEFATDTISFDTGGSERLRIASNGATTVKGDFSVESSLAKMSMIDTDGGDYFQLRNDGGTFKIRNSSDGRDDISITNNLLTFGGVVKITDNNSIFFGNDNDIEMRHNATSGENQIIAKNHNFKLQSYGTILMQCFQSGNSNNGNVLTANYNAGTALYYQNGERLVTQNGGCKISNNLTLNNWLHIGKSGGYTSLNSVGHDNSNGYVEGINWHVHENYGIYRTKANWSNPYAQLRLDWPTGIAMAGGTSYGLSGVRFMCAALPSANNTYDLGTSSLRWRDVYCNQGAFNNSDIELKQDIASLTAAEMKAAKRLSALFKTYRWKDAVEEKGTDKARIHTGMIAQQIQAEMSAEGLDAAKYGLFGIDEWYENDKKEIITLDQLKDNIPDPLDSSKTISPMSTEGYTKVTRYSVRYTELLSFIAAYNDQRFADLESRVAALEGS